MKKKAWIISVITFLLLAAALGIVQYYIWSNAFITEFHADYTDTLLWAQASLDSGSLFKPDFEYAYRLAFGGQWLFMPFLKIFGIGMTALRSGMCLFSILLTLALVFFFRSLKSTRKLAIFNTAVMLMTFCATKKTREIFFGHIIHYSLAVFFLLIGLILLYKLLNGNSARERIVFTCLLALCLFMCSADGMPEILYVTLPLLAGCLLEWYLQGDKKLLLAAGILMAAACAGFFFTISYRTNYSDSYSVIVPSKDWTNNLLLFPIRWVSLFYKLPSAKLESFSGVWIKTILKLFIALSMLAGLVLSFSRYKKLNDREERIVYYTAWAMFAGFLFFFVFGRISDIDWRLLPLVFSCETVVLIQFNHALLSDRERSISAGLSLICGFLLILHAASDGMAVMRIPYDKKIWFAEDGLLETLKAHDLNYGYITTYWLSSSTTVLSDNTVKLRYAEMSDKGNIYLNLFNSDLEWYEDQPGQDRYFLAMFASQYDPDSDLAKEALETYTCFQEDTRNSRKDDFVILVLPRNIMKEEHDRLAPRYR